jgi:hypothetical protein
MNKPLIKCIIYIIISALTAISTDIVSYHSFSEISSMKWFCLGVNVLLQSLIALKAFLDQSISDTTKQ